MKFKTVELWKIVETGRDLSLENGDTMGERMGRIGRIRTDFFLVIP
jgi:hypothetical protein